MTARKRASRGMRKNPNIRAGEYPGAAKTTVRGQAAGASPSRSGSKGRSGRAPYWAMMAAAQALPRRPQAARSRPMRVAAQEARRVEVAGTGGVEHARRRHGVDDMHLLAAQHHGALGPAGQRREMDVAADLLQRLVEVGDLVEADDLGLVGEQDVDTAIDQLAELGAPAVDAETVGEGQRQLLARPGCRCRPPCGRRPWPRAGPTDSPRGR